MVLLFGLLDQPLELISKILISRLKHAALPHTRSSLHQIVETDVGLSLTIRSFDVIRLMPFSLMTME